MWLPGVSSTSSYFVGAMVPSSPLPCSASPSIVRFSLPRFQAGAVSLSRSVFGLIVSSQSHFRDSGSCPSPDSSFYHQFFEFSASVVPSLGAVTCAWFNCTLAVSPSPRSLPWLCLLIIGGFRFFSSSFTAFASLIGLLPFYLWLLVLSV